MAKRPATGAPGLTRRQMSRAKREALLQRWILIGAAIFAVAAIGVIGYGVLNEQYLKPNRPVVTVGDQKITGTEFTNEVKVNYYLQFGGQIPLSAYGLDAQSYSQIVLTSLTNDLLVSQKAKEKGITVSDQELQRQVQLAFNYTAGTPAPTPTPTETSSPTPAEATATSTFVLTLTPTATDTLVPPGTATPTLTPTVAESTSTPTPTGFETPTSSPSPQPTPTVVTADGYNKDLTDFLNGAATSTGLTADQVKTIWFTRVRASLLRDKLIAAFNLTADKQKTLLHIGDILVTTGADAQKALDQINGGTAFEVVAAKMSIDSTTAYKGGDLGWIGPGDRAQDFEDAASRVAVGQLSPSVKLQDGWHVIKVYDSKQELTTNAEQQQQIQQKFTALLNQWKTDYKVVSDNTWQEFVPNIQ